VCSYCIAIYCSLLAQSTTHTYIVVKACMGVNHVNFFNAYILLSFCVIDSVMCFLHDSDDAVLVLFSWRKVDVSSSLCSLLEFANLLSN